jgi:hypothetical protein
MPNAQTRSKFYLRWNADDAEIAEELRKLTGLRTVSDVIRAALRAQYRAITHHPFRPAERPTEPGPATGTEG